MRRFVEIGGAVLDADEIVGLLPADGAVVVVLKSGQTYAAHGVDLADVLGLLAKAYPAPVPTEPGS